MPKNYGQIAYEAYRDESKGKSLYSGKPIPEWDRMDPNIHAAWDAAASAVIETHWEDKHAYR